MERFVLLPDELQCIVLACVPLHRAYDILHTIDIGFAHNRYDMKRKAIDGGWHTASIIHSLQTFETDGGVRPEYTD
jgi:hypothetical protein